MSDKRSEIEKRRARLSPEQRALLEQRLRGVGAASDNRKIPRRTAGEPAPLSFSQQGLFFLERLSPGLPEYNIPLVFRLTGTLNPSLLIEAFDQVVQRHEVLRTHFVYDEGKLTQAVDLFLPGNLKLEVLEETAEDSGWGKALAKAGELAVSGFDFSAGPLFRAVLYRLAEHEFVFAVVVHHILFDGWSMGVLFKELSECYAALLQQRQPELPELPLQFADYAAWQHDRAAQGDFQADLEYWRQRLASPLPELAFLRPGGDDHSAAIAGGLAIDELTADTVLALKAFCQRQRTTLFAVLLSIWKTLLFRYSGQTDILVGTAVAVRRRPELEPLLGYFVNTLPLRTVVDGQLSFLQFLARVHAEAIEAQEHQDLPFEILVQELKLSRSSARVPLVQNLFVVENAPTAALAFDGVKVSPIALHNRTAKFPLTLMVFEDGSDIRLELEYEKRLFDAEAAGRLLRHLRILLKEALADPEQSIARLPLSDEAERRLVLEAWSGATVAYPRDSSVPALFAQQAQAAPQAVAVQDAQTQLTYAALEAAANRLARWLQQHGVAAGDRVALGVERGVGAVTAILAVLKAGAAYVPLDPDQPPARLQLILEDTKPVLVLASESYLGRFPADTPALVCLERELTGLEELSAEPLNDGPQATDLAYIMYTSGSTGAPKGVCIEHRGIVRLVKNTTYVELGPAHTHLLFAPLAFDASTFELWGPLLNGGRLVVAPPGLLSLEELGGLVAQTGVTTLWLTAGLFHQAVEQGLERFTGLRQWLAGGDVLWPTHVRRALEALPGVTLINGYGPTESTTFTCCHVMRTLAEVDSPVPIGRPIANTRVFILNEQREPAPIGVAGELYIGGDGVARGYLNDPELTAARFIASPFPQLSGARLYKSGDRARFRADGTVEFLGRLDTQVKLRGFRLELSEIEGALLQHPAVSQVAVVLQEDAAREKRLVAYVVLRQPEAITARDLRQQLRERLPEYMVPATFVLLATLPLNANGKVDRTRLPAPPLDDRPVGTPLEPPRNALEAHLVELWEEVLGHRPIGIHDDFFQLGGHSLLVLQVISHVRQRFGVTVAIKDLFTSPTIAGLAATIDQARRTGQGISDIPLEPIPREGDLPLSFAQKRLWFLDQLEPNSPAYNIPFALRLIGNLDVNFLESSLQELPRRHEIWRTEFANVDGRPVQRVCESMPVRLERVDLRALPEADLQADALRYAAEAAWQPFVLTTGPLWRCLLLQLADHEHWLVLVVHHIVADGWSIEVIVKELNAFYQAFASGGRVELPELPIQYADYAHWQQKWLQGARLEDQLSYWKNHLAGDLPVLELPTDYPRSRVQTYAAGQLSHLLPEVLTRRLKELGQRQGATLFMTLLAAFKVLLHRYSGQEDILVGFPAANRNCLETENLIGFFVNTLVLRTDLSGNPRFVELLKKVREHTLGAYDHQDLPFERLVEELHPERDLSHTPIFQVWFNMVNLPESKPELGGLTVEYLPLPTRYAKFDLTVYIAEKDACIHFDLVYNADLFLQARMTSLLEQFHYLLEQLVQAPEAGIQSFSLIPPAHQRWLPDPQRPLDSACEKLIHTDFSAQAQRVPDRLAIEAPDGVWTYGELDERSQQLAALLRARDLGAEDCVATYGCRSAALALALLGVLKAGAAFAILDPAYPAPRLIDCLHAAQPKAWLQLEGADPPAEPLRQFVDAQPYRCRLTLPSEPTAIASRLSAFSPAALDLPIAPGSLAYLAFTSGSTGKPKGIAGTHRPVAHFLDWHVSAFGLRETDRFAMLSGLSHDPLLRDIFTPLSIGATLCVPDLERLSPGQLLEWMEERRISVVHLTPAMGKLLCAASDTASLPSLRWAFFGGDVLTQKDITALKALAPAVTCVNFYGATETPQAMSYFVCGEEAMRRGKQAVPLGVGIDGVQLLLLNAGQRLAGIGEMGEIAIRTPFLSRGYLQKEDPAVKRFTVNPLSTLAQDRLFRTGDLGRYRPDGAVEFVGRQDHQVKIRGFRIELEEIEVLLLEHPLVQQAAVAVSEDAAGEKRLVAYVAGKPSPADWDGELTENALTEFLRGRLPHYMIPSGFVCLEALPLMPNRKIDRARLPAPEQNSRSVDRKAMPPRNSLEAQLVDLWEEMLNTRPIGIDSDFFALGGHSLLAVQLFARMEKILDKKIPLSLLFQSSTIARLLDSLNRPDKGKWSFLVPIKTSGSRKPLFLFHALTGQVLHYHNLGRYFDVDRPLFGVQAPDQPFDRIETMAAHYLEEIRQLQPEGPYLLGGYCFGGIVAYEVAQRLIAGGQHVAFLALIESWPPNWSLKDLEWNLALVKNLLISAPFWLQESLCQPWTVARRLLRRGRDLLAPLTGEYEEKLDLTGFYQDYHEYVKIHVNALRRYAVKPYAGPITLFQSRNLTLHHLDPEMGWKRFVSGHIAKQLVSGPHADILYEPHVKILGQRINECMLHLP